MAYSKTDFYLVILNSFLLTFHNFNKAYANVTKIKKIA